jgi:hypothetical protein
MRTKNQFIIFSVAVLIATANSFSAEVNAATRAKAVKTQILEETIRFYRHCRVENGLYLDRLSLTSTNHPDCVSISSTGVGLLSQVIGVELGVVQKAIVIEEWNQTLTTLLNNPHLEESRVEGFYSHWYTSKGVELNYSEISTIDMAILQICLFWGAERLNDDEISNQVLEIFRSTNWPLIINGTSGVYREISKEGIPESVSYAFSEYCIPAYLAEVAAGTNGYMHQKVFETFLPSHNTAIPRYEFESKQLLSDSRYSALSSFVPQFSWFFCPPARSELASELVLYQKCDSTWFSTNSTKGKWNYGSGAGSGYPSGYAVNKINSNANMIVSPSAIAGYIPVVTSSSYALDSMIKYKSGRYKLPGSSDSILWRYSLKYGNYAKEVQSIDMTGLLFGTAYLVLGPRFFNFDIKVSEHPMAVKYSVFSSMDSVSDIEISKTGQVFVVNNHILYLKTGANSFSSVSVPDAVNDIALSDTYMYVACDHHIFKIPLNILSSFLIVDTWSWDEYRQIKVKTGIDGQDTLLYFIDSFGSRSGWTIQYPNQTKTNFTWGHHSREGFFDQIADSLGYVSAGAHERYNILKQKFTGLNVSIAGAFRYKKCSLLVTSTEYSNDYGSHFQKFSKPLGIKSYSASGFVQINEAELAFSDSYQDKIMLLKNGSTIFPTTSGAPDKFYLKAYDGKDLWGWVGSTSGILVAIPFSSYKYENWIDFPASAPPVYYSSGNDELALNAVSRYGNVKYKSSDENIAYFIGNTLKIIADGNIVITAFVPESGSVAYVEKSQLFSFQNTDPVSINEISVETCIGIYPNPIPANSPFNISTVEGLLSSISIIDSNGIIFYKDRINDFSRRRLIQIIAPAKPGLYIVTITTNDGKMKSSKIIVLP